MLQEDGTRAIATVQPCDIAANAFALDSVGSEEIAMELFPGFKRLRRAGGDSEIHAILGGKGPPLLFS